MKVPANRKAMENWVWLLFMRIDIIVNEPRFGCSISSHSRHDVTQPMALFCSVRKWILLVSSSQMIHSYLEANFMLENQCVVSWQKGNKGKTFLYYTECFCWWKWCNYNDPNSLALFYKSHTFVKISRDNNLHFNSISKWLGLTCFARNSNPAHECHLPIQTARVPNNILKAGAYGFNYHMIHSPMPLNQSIKWFIQCAFLFPATACPLRSFQQPEAARIHS